MKHVHTEPTYPYTQVYAENDASQEMINLALYIVDQLPHGSGIDATWTVTAYDNRIECNNELHAMDENGFYAGWYALSVEFTAEETERIYRDQWFVAECVTEEQDNVYMKNYTTINPWYTEEEE